MAPFRCLIDAIENAEAGFGARTLSNLRIQSWDVMNNYTHTGRLQVGRRIRDDEFVANYEAKEIVEALRCCASIAMLAVQHTCLLGNREDRAHALIEVIQGYAERGRERMDAFERLQSAK